jgi:UDP-glucose:glycoprotein glucosyltransferase
VQVPFEALAASEEIKEGEAISFDSLVGGASEVFEAKISKARGYARRLGTDAASSPNGHIFINGKYYVLNDVCTALNLVHELYLIGCRTS